MGDHRPDEDSVLQIDAEVPLPPTPNDEGYATPPERLPTDRTAPLPRRPRQRPEAYPFTHTPVITNPPKLSTMLSTNDKHTTKWTWNILDYLDTSTIHRKQILI
ncbi:hypothetical protein SARC_05564 [Sphaeroforma arctica JP610]|uniref:Uncharacterized protein n=1 Tax=Sphaeroforma arctica JP610 TaxID=667725 RepID=A0A0L0FZX0_9EUKA|nr:hypothetical protein SARC_05564 [Sphaeroforma arctica JP610]KNC82144.1 hypothetical protein SARC_05564 [Sphaeroforma arctica JP610]|eukprot:XP_014156046.1 hypothetical protein SARC_05564 [Sphaeroforma arctica JP610]